MMSEAETYDYLFKLILIGDDGVGKTSIFSRFCNSVVNMDLLGTAGVDFRIRTIDLDGKKIKLQIWDNNGSQRFRTFISSYYRGVHGIMFVYDVTDRESLSNITEWICHAEQHAPTDVERMLIGNRCDSRRRVVEREKGENFAREHGLLLFETSAKENINVEEAFLSLIRAIKAKADANPNPPTPVNQPLSKPSPIKNPDSSYLSSCSIN